MWSYFERRCYEFNGYTSAFEVLEEEFKMTRLRATIAKD